MDFLSTRRGKVMVVLVLGICGVGLYLWWKTRPRFTAPGNPSFQYNPEVPGQLLLTWVESSGGDPGQPINYQYEIHKGSVLQQQGTVVGTTVNVNTWNYGETLDISITAHSGPSSSSTTKASLQTPDTPPLAPVQSVWTESNVVTLQDNSTNGWLSACFGCPEGEAPPCQGGNTVISVQGTMSKTESVWYVNVASPGVVTLTCNYAQPTPAQFGVCQNCDPSAAYIVCLNEAGTYAAWNQWKPTWDAKRNGWKFESVYAPGNFLAAGWKGGYYARSDLGTSNFVFTVKLVK